MTDETGYSIGEGPATRVSLSLPEGTAEAIRQRVGRREFSAFITAAVAANVVWLIALYSYVTFAASPRRQPASA